MIPILAADVDLPTTLLTHLTPMGILAIGIMYLVMKDRTARKNGNGKPAIICPLNPQDLHQDLRDIVNKLDKLVESMARLMGRLENGGRRKVE